MGCPDSGGHAGALAVRSSEVEGGTMQRNGARASGVNGHSPPALSLQFPSELIDVIAERAAELLTGREKQEEGWLRGAEQIADYLDCPRSRVYALTSAGRIPVHRDGSSLVARPSELDRWLREGGGVRP